MPYVAECEKNSGGSSVNIVFCAYFQSNNTLGQTHSHPKAQTPKHKYCFKDSADVYTGDTKQHILNRMRHHGS